MWPDKQSFTINGWEIEAEYPFEDNVQLPITFENNTATIASSSEMPNNIYYAKERFTIDKDNNNGDHSIIIKFK